MKNKLVSIVLVIFASASLIAGCSQTIEETEEQTQIVAATELETDSLINDTRTIIQEFDSDNIFGLKGIYTEDNTITLTYDIYASQAYVEETPMNIYSCLKNNSDYYITLGTNDNTYLIRDFEVTEDNENISITLITRGNISYTDLAWICINDYLINMNDYRLVYTRLSGNESSQYSQSYHKSVGSWGTMETTIILLDD